MWMYLLVLALPAVLGQGMNNFADGSQYFNSPNFYNGGLGSLRPYGDSPGYGPFGGLGTGLFSPAPRYGQPFGANLYRPSLKEIPKLTGVNVFAEKGVSYSSTGSSGSGYYSGLAVTITKNQAGYGGLFFGDNNKGYGDGQGLSINIQAQTPKAGVYKVVLTSLARVQDGCSLRTLGDILNNQQPYFSMYTMPRGSDFFSNGVVATIELSGNAMKSLSLARLPMFDNLQDLAGRGVALCLDDGRDDRLCRGYIAACVGLHYTQDDAVLDIRSLTSTNPGYVKHQDDAGYVAQSNQYDNKNSGNPTVDHKNNDEDLDTYQPPANPPSVTYEPDTIKRAPPNNGPVNYKK